MAEPRMGRQIPTQSVVLPYSFTHGEEAIALYESAGRTAQEWQKILIYDILAYNEEQLWIHTKIGYSVPRRNGKNEVVAIRELYGLQHGEHILHTAHRTSTSTSAAARLAELLNDSGWEEVQRVQKNAAYSKHYTYSKQVGMEKIALLDGSGGVIWFRTRTSKGGLGEGFDLLVIDEAQEYLDDQESSLKYVVSSSKNPQTIFCGTPPTAVSSGTIFPKMRRNALSGESVNTGWAEWSIESMGDPKDKELWYQTNPSLGTILTERAILDEIGTDDVDFNIQRLGLWIQHNQKSAISRAEWEALMAPTLPRLNKSAFVGIKYGLDGSNVSLSVAVKTLDGKVFVETIDCRPVRDGNAWIIDLLKGLKPVSIIIDGESGRELLIKDLKQNKIKGYASPTVKEVITAYANFEQGIFSETITHMNQPALTQAVSNCEKRNIGSNGGFGYRALKVGIDISILDSVVLAYWACNEVKEKRRQRIVY